VSTYHIAIYPQLIVLGIKVLKCVEGQCNKALLLTMSTGQEIVAKTPNPNAGPSFYTTASEVATRQFVGVLAHDLLRC
jgi:hypothetical protein